MRWNAALPCFDIIDTVGVADMRPQNSFQVLSKWAARPSCITQSDIPVYLSAVAVSCEG